MIRVALLSLLTLLTACASTAVTETPMDRNQLSGSKFRLTQSLTIPGGSAGVTLQFGEPVKPNDINRYYPHCRLEVNDVRATPQTVMPDEFDVRRMVQIEQTVERAGLQRVSRLYSASSVSFVVFRTILDLNSARQPQVRTLTCQHWDSPASGQHLSLNQIQQALGKVIVLAGSAREAR